MKEQLRKMEDSTAASRMVATAIFRLNAEAQEIGRILESISGFDTQANLLALNACRY